LKYRINAKQNFLTASSAGGNLRLKFYFADLATEDGKEAFKKTACVVFG